MYFEQCYISSKRVILFSKLPFPLVLANIWAIGLDSLVDEQVWQDCIKQSNFVNYSLATQNIWLLEQMSSLFL